MTPEQFCYWLQGQMELKGGQTKLSQDQIQMIADHLQTVFTKVTPEYEPIKAPNDWPYGGLSPAICSAEPVKACEPLFASDSPRIGGGTSN